jgi:sugar (pentulose or hexulose) kinase
MYCRVQISEVRAVSIVRALIALIMEAARTSETSVDIQLGTRQYIPEDSELQLYTRRRENLKSHIHTYTQIKICV